MQVVVVALLVVFVSRILFKHHQRLNSPPEPTALPIIGCLHLLGKQPYKNFVDLAQKYRPIMSVQVGQRYYVIATSPEVVKEFLKHQDANFSPGPTNVLLRSFLQKVCCNENRLTINKLCLSISKGHTVRPLFQFRSNQGAITLSDVIFHDITPVSQHLKKILVSELMSAKRLESSKYIRNKGNRLYAQLNRSRDEPIHPSEDSHQHHVHEYRVLNDA